MDRITHQSPRQRGYGSTSSLRNDSLKHTRKHEKGREESNQEAKHTGSGGLSAPTPRTVRPYTADRPKKLTEPLETTPNNGPSAGSARTVRQAPADRPPTAADCPKPRPMKTQSHDGSKAKPSKNTKKHEKNLLLADRPPSPRGLSAPYGQNRKTARPRRSTPPNHHQISQTIEAVETRVWGLEKRHTRMLYPKNLAS
jgi:hypothetical protein